MAGGKTLLFRGILCLDIGVFSGSVLRLPTIYPMLYFMGLMAFNGLVDILRAFEARKIAGAWRLRLSQGLVNILAVVLCLAFFRHDARVVVVICSVNLIYSALVRIFLALRPSRVVLVTG